MAAAKHDHTIYLIAAAGAAAAAWYFRDSLGLGGLVTSAQTEFDKLTGQTPTAAAQDSAGKVTAAGYSAYQSATAGQIAATGSTAGAILTATIPVTASTPPGTTVGPGVTSTAGGGVAGTPAAVLAYVNSQLAPSSPGAPVSTVPSVFNTVAGRAAVGNAIDAATAAAAPPTGTIVAPGVTSTGGGVAGDTASVYAYELALHPNAVATPPTNNSASALPPPPPPVAPVSAAALSTLAVDTAKSTAATAASAGATPQQQATAAQQAATAVVATQLDVNSLASRQAAAAAIDATTQALLPPAGDTVAPGVTSTGGGYVGDYASLYAFLSAQ